MRLLVLLFSIISYVTSAQDVVSGIVTAESTGTPIAGASVFFTNTSYGTVTNEKGNFSLTVPFGKYDLVVSSVGFETKLITIQTNVNATGLQIKLLPKAAILDDVLVSTYEKDGWKKWGKFFTEHFIGTTDWASSCVIKNTSEIKFRHDKKSGKLLAVAFAPIEIENKALGYKLTYDLQSFEYDFNKHYLVFVGYPFFKEMQGRSGQLRKWLANRQDAYEGSMMHFMRSLYRNKLEEEGFEVRRLVKQVNHEKKRISALIDQRLKASNIKNNISIADLNTVYGDSSQYYKKVLEQPNQLSFLINQIITGDSIAYALDSVTAGLEFKDYLQIFYKRKITPFAFNKGLKEREAMISELTLVNGTPLEIQSSGSIYPPTEALSLGYWAWSEKISAMLPTDYKPSKNNNNEGLQQ